MGGGRTNFLPNTTSDPEYPDESGRREDGRNLTEVNPGFKAQCMLYFDSHF